MTSHPKRRDLLPSPLLSIRRASDFVQTGYTCLETAAKPDTAIEKGMAGPGAAGVHRDKQVQ